MFSLEIKKLLLVLTLGTVWQYPLLEAKVHSSFDVASTVVKFRKNEASF